MGKQSKIILISGPTASGKSNFAVKIAKKINGEIINADSMQVYKQLKTLTARPNKKDIEQRKLPNQTTGLVITNIGKNSPVNYLNIGDVIVEAQKKKIKSIKDLEDIVNKALKSNQKTILIVIYNSQNQRRYIGIKLD